MFGFHNVHGKPVSVQRLQAEAQAIINDAAENDFGPLVREYRRYVCPVCSDHHMTESGAEACCAPEIDVVYVLDGNEYETPAELVEALQGETPALFCPVCSADHADAEDAAECCLWKTHGPAQRYIITKAVERGESWADAIAAATQGA